MTDAELREKLDSSFNKVVDTETRGQILNLIMSHITAHVALARAAYVQERVAMHAEASWHEGYKTCADDNDLTVEANPKAFSGGALDRALAAAKQAGAEEARTELSQLRAQRDDALSELTEVRGFWQAAKAELANCREAANALADELAELRKPGPCPKRHPATFWMIEDDYGPNRIPGHCTLCAQIAAVLPYAYAYRYADDIRFDTGGRSINGGKPIEAIPLYSIEQIRTLIEATERKWMDIANTNALQREAWAERYEAETKVLREALERDRSNVALYVTAIKKELESRDWLREGRGSYKWNDDRWHAEFEAATIAIWEAIEPLARIAADWSNCSRDPEDITKARAALSNSSEPKTIHRGGTGTVHGGPESTFPNSARKRDQILSEMTDIIVGHLESMPVAERKQRIEAFIVALQPGAERKI